MIKDTNADVTRDSVTFTEIISDPSGVELLSRELFF